MLWSILSTQVLTLKETRGTTKCVCGTGYARTETDSEREVSSPSPRPPHAVVVQVKQVRQIVISGTPELSFFFLFHLVLTELTFHNML